MDKTLQEKFRNELVDAYLKVAWEAFANYDFYGKRYKKIEDQILDSEAKQASCNDQIEAINKLPNAHSVENREKIRLLKKDVDGYKERIENVINMRKKLWDETVAWQEKGSRLLEQAENFKSFRVKTPEEIEADKKQKNV